uniref:Uncharacterized protein n=1 Tax=Setaria italica TaxID=4555 RepID=K3ZFX8_SETIT
MLLPLAPFCLSFYHTGCKGSMWLGIVDFPKA